MLARFLDDVSDGNMISPRRMAERLRLPMTELSRLAHVNRNALATQADSPKVQRNLGEIARVIAQAARLSGDEDKAIIWFRHQPIPGFGGKTAAELVESGHADAVVWYLHSLEEGVYA